MDESAIRVLIVDDYAPWRRYVRAVLEKNRALQIVGEVSDGWDAVREAERLQPDLILIDISLPSLNGLEAARRIQKLAANAKILFVSENRSAEIARNALESGGNGYVVKWHAARDILTAVDAVLGGKQFVSAKFLDDQSDHASTHLAHLEIDVAPLPPQNVPIRHEVAFYRDDAAFVSGFASVARAALKHGNPLIVITNEAHRAEIYQHLRAAADIDVNAAVEKGLFIWSDVFEILSIVIAKNTPDRSRCEDAVSQVITRASASAQRQHARVTICGECAPTLLLQGHVEAAVQLEHIWDAVTRSFGADTLCGYVGTSIVHASIVERICAEHSAIHDRPLGYYTNET